MTGKGDIQKVTLDKKLCISCNLCISLAEEVFEMKGDKAVVIKEADLTSKRNYKEAKGAEQACPVGAIKVFE